MIPTATKGRLASIRVEYSVPLTDPEHFVTSTPVPTHSSVAPEHWLPGVSMAVPRVTGAAALIAQRYPGLTIGQMRSALHQLQVPGTERSPGAVGISNDGISGYGLIDVTRLDSVKIDPATSTGDD